MAGEATEQLRAYVEYFRDLGIHDFYRQGDPVSLEEQSALLGTLAPPPTAPVSAKRVEVVPSAPPQVAAPIASSPKPMPPLTATSGTAPSAMSPPVANPAEEPLESSIVSIPKPVSFDQLVALPSERVAPEAKSAALKAIQTAIGDCTRCPL